MTNPQVHDPIVGDHRRYHVTGILGQGGFGTVYRARLDGPEGFQKDVAIKIMRDLEPPQDVLARFRDEARILGLVRNPHVVSVDPPVKLGGRWAVVMEYVDGASCEEILASQPFPATIALEICEIVAATLHQLFHAVDNEGRALQLVHRDLKPSNIQLTPQGFVKLLDFGVARAEFEQRETATVAQIGGTPGYIAPERLEGHDSWEGDIYSLGVVLHRLITRQRPPTHVPTGSGKTPDKEIQRHLHLQELMKDPDLRAVLEFAAALRDLDYTQRPSGEEVASACRELRQAMRGPSLREWAPKNVPNGPRKAPDEMVGRTLSETLSRMSKRLNLPEGEFLDDEPVAQRSDPVVWVGVLAIVAGVLGTVLVFVLGVIVVLWVVGAQTTTAQNDVEFGEYHPPGAKPMPIPLPGTAPGPAPEVPAPTPVAPEPAEAGPKEPKPKPAAPEPPTPAPAPSASTGRVSVSGEAQSVQLVCEGRKYGPSEAVPVGTCEILAVFAGGAPTPAGTVTVSAGATTEVTCSAQFLRCRAK